MRLQVPVDLSVAVFEVLRPVGGLVPGDRVLVRPVGGAFVYELYRVLPAEQAEELIRPGNVELTATEPGGAYAEAARLFARAPSAQQPPLRLEK